MPNRAYKRLLLVGDERKGGSKALIQHHATWLTGRGCECEIVMDRESSLEDREADCVVVWGGDGSLLAAARRMRRDYVVERSVEDLGREAVERIAHAHEQTQVHTEFSDRLVGAQRGLFDQLVRLRNETRQLRLCEVDRECVRAARRR